MGRRQDVSVVDERAAAELSSGVEEGGDPRPFARVCGLPAHDALLILIAVLRAALRQVEARRAGDGGRLAGGRRGGRGRPPGRLLRRPRGGGAGFLGAARGDRLRGCVRRQTRRRRMGRQWRYRVVRWVGGNRWWPRERSLRSHDVRALVLLLLVVLDLKPIRVFRRAIEGRLAE